jgi:hypothetical protein
VLLVGHVDKVRSASLHDLLGQAWIRRRWCSPGQRVSHATPPGIGAVIPPANGSRAGAAGIGWERKPPLDAPPSYDEMVTRIAGGDEGALAELYDRICPQVLGLVQRFRVDDEQAEELVHGIFLEIWRTAPLFDGTNTTAAAWILSLAHLQATA